MSSCQPVVSKPWPRPELTWVGNHSGELRDAELRGWPDGNRRHVTDPQNLTWVMPAEEGVDRHNSQRPAVVFAGGDPIDTTGVDALPTDALVRLRDAMLEEEAS